MDPAGRSAGSDVAAISVGLHASRDYPVQGGRGLTDAPADTAVEV
jgi:hypothetical protein